MSELATIFLAPAGCLHDLRLLLASAPESVRTAFFDDDVAEYFRGADVARQKAEWCESWARRTDLPDYDREFFAHAANILRMAIPMLPEHAPPDPPVLRQSIDKDYSRSVAEADRRYLRRRR